MSALWLAAAAGAAGAAMSASSAAAQTLKEALLHAHQTNPTLQAEIAQRRAAATGITRSWSSWLPSITAGADYGAARTESAALLSPQGGGAPARRETSSTREPWGYDFSLSQNLYAGGASYSGSSQARHLSAAAGQTLRQTAQQVLLDAATAYFNVLRDQAIVELNENNITVLRRQMEATRQRFTVGEITRTDVAQSESRLSGARSTLAGARAGLTASRSFFARVIGREAENLSFTPLPPLPKNRGSALEYARANHPSLLASRARFLAARAARGVARAAFLPSVNLDARYRYGEEPAETVLESESSSFTARVNVPLFRGFASWAGYREASHLVARARFQRREAERRVDEGVVNGWDALEAARARIVSTTEQERASRIAYEGVRQEASVGSRTTLDVLDAQQELLNAQVALASSRREAQVAAYRLLSATGLLNARHLGLEKAER